MESSGSEEELSDMKRPPLVRDLRAILEEYPDNGQIFKELIQNAEDAGASQVRIIYDSFGAERETSSCPHFQGPAIYVCNNARFTEEDWEGIKMLRKSVKEVDRLKVGRYGLGFKSVFHITDFPSITSGDTLLLLDPSKPEHRVCATYRLSNLKSKTVQRMRQVFGKVLDMSSLDRATTDGFDGTVFRFPLRQSCSELSPVVYDDGRVCDLLKCFRTEMMIVLVFLKSLECVEIWSPQQGKATPKLSFSVCLTDESAKQRKDQKEILNQALAAEPTSVWTSSVNCEVKDHSSGLNFRLNWTVKSIKLGRDEMSSSLRALSDDPALSYPPFVGVSVVDVPLLTRKTILDMKLMETALQGHVYCFLPLPLQHNSLTGLPVHVNGYFALSSNRHHLKWPTADEEHQGWDSQRDKSCRWNRGLLTEAVPKVYSLLIDELIETSKKHKNPKDYVQAVYNAFPSVGSASNMWVGVVQGFYEHILTKPCFFSEEGGGRWVTFREAVFCEDKSVVPEEVLGILKHLGITVTCVPEGLFDTVRHFVGNKMEQVTTRFVRNVLKKTLAYKQESHFQKLHLLNFIMEDLVENKDFDDLWGIRLLPLSDGTFTTFQDQREETKFSATKTFDRCLFPGLENQFLTESSIHQFPDGLKKKLKILIQSGKTQLRPVRKDDFRKLIEQVTKIFGGQNRERIKLWMTNVWKALCSEFPSNLREFQGLTLLPISAPFGVTLEKLQYPPVKVLKRYGRTVLSGVVESVVKKMGVQVLTEVVPEVLKHPNVIGVFVLEPTASSVLQALSTARDYTHDTMDLSLSKEQRSEFVTFIASCDRLFTLQEHGLLTSLRLFEAVGPNENISHVSVQELQKSAPEEVIPITFPCKLIKYGSLAEKSLGAKLGVQQLNRGDLVLLVLKKMRLEPNMYMRSQVIHFMEHIFSNRSGLNKEVWDLVGNISFIPCTDDERTLRKLSELFDPTIPKLRDLFVGEDVFPGKEWENYTPILRSLGLKSRPTEQDLLSCAVKLENMQTEKEHDVLNRKCRAVISAIADRTDLSSRIVDKLKTVAILPIKRDRPSHFPQKMPWFSSTRFLAKPSEAMDKRYQNLIGSVMPITVLPDDLTQTQKSNLVQMLELSRPPSLSKLLEQMKITMRNFDPDNVDFFVTAVKKIYRELQKFSYQAIWSEMNDQKIDRKWIWNGKEFSSSQKIYVEEANEDLDLAPYMVCLPVDMRDLKDFFLSFGCHKNQDQEMMLDVLHMIEKKYSKPKARQKAKVHRDIQIVLRMLHHLSAYVEEGNLLEAARILIPVEVAGKDEYFKMMPANQCVYYDSSEWISVEDILADDRDLHIVHRNVPRELAYSLGVSPLMDKLLDAQELDMNYGQLEPLTRRLRNLIQHYTDGVAVMKELVQNADDAGATRVCFLYDERQNANFRNRLIHENMAECQGPALWAYNNAVFTDEDFQNITKISGATKLYKAAKIGKFGLGFNAVYNLTDVPSFVSRDLFVIFDPHETFLGKPGLKMNIRKNRRMVNQLREQFQPYNGVFGCDFDTEDALNFQGTLFRFPLRTSDQADRSQISNLHYSHREMIKLLQMSLECAGNLLMFTRNVTNIKFFHLSSTETDASTQTPLFEVSKSNTDHMIMVQMINNIEKCEKLNLKPACERKTEVTWFKGNSKGGQRVSHFLSVNREMEALHPEGSVVIPVQTTGNQSYEAIPIEKSPTGFLKHGLVYCYLPLPIPTKLPVLINGSFSVTSDRRRLSEKNVDEKKNLGSEWNEILLEDSLAKSYINALQLLAAKGHQQMFELWPTETNCDAYLEPLLRGFYGSLSSDQQEILPGRDRFTNMQNAVFLESKLRFDTGKTGQVAFEVFNKLVKKTENIAVDLPEDIQKCFSRFGRSQLVDKNTFSIHQFFTKLFLPRIEEIEPEQRDVLVLHALKGRDPILLRALKETRCIPVDYCGSLCMPCDLIHPEGEIACLYDNSENRFPVGSKITFCNPLMLDVLKDLGMLKDILPPAEVPGRASTIERLSQHQPDKALSRLKALIRVLVKMNWTDSLDLSTDDKDKLNTLRFLPVLHRPTLWPSSLQWKADGGPTFECPRNLYHDKGINLIGSQRLVLNCDGLGYVPETLLKKLGILSEVSAADLILHLRHLTKVKTSELSSDEISNLQQIYEQVYSFLEKCCTESEEIPKWTREITELNSIFHEKEHVSPQCVAFKFNYNCSPFLFRLSERYSRLYPNTMHLLGVKGNFSRFDCVHSLQEFYEIYNNVTLDLNTIRLLNRMLTALVETVKSEHGTLSKEDLNEIMLPDKDGKLCLSEMLCFDDCSWINDSSGVMRYVHSSVSPETAELLGVKTKQHWCLSQNAEGFQIPFGQKEDLTNRLKGILRGYPCDSTIMKELLQNADDAGATEIQFIKDWRSHENKKIFSEEWKELQGPALCVYSDAAFTDEDLEGIQSLGKGSKRDDPLKTGKYGIGFNVVYHLTDVPSFLIKRQTEEILCAFDPNRKYIPNMSPMLSGMKWQNLPQVRKRFPDSFACYPESILNQNTVGALFRFPLRNASMAEKSEIKNEPISVNKLDDLFKEFKKESKEALLFTKNVHSIKIIDVTQDGTLKTVYEIKANLDKDSLKQKKQIHLQRQNVITELHSGLSVENVTTTEVKYLVEIQEEQTSERWFVKQRIGFENPKEVPDELKVAISQKTLNHLPIGGVAFPLIETRQRKCKAFCGLPLPVLTGLPVHIDGDFALDYEQRRHLYYSPHGDVRTKWNKTLAEQLLAPLYASGIVDLKEVLFQATHSVQGSIEQYHGFFPLNEKAMDHYWKDLCLAVYKHLDSTSSRVLCVTHKTLSGKEVVKKWLPPTGQHELEAFFNTLKTQCDETVSGFYRYGIVERARETPLRSSTMASLLLALDFNLVSTPLSIYKNFCEAKIGVEVVSPESVVMFLRTYSGKYPLCVIGNLPCPLEHTSFKTEGTFFELLSYCTKYDKLNESLEGLPLLLTYDKTLQVFRESEKVFVSKHSQVVPHSAGSFLHHRARIILSLDDENLPKIPQVKQFRIKDFSTLLRKELDESVFGSNEPVYWDDRTVVDNFWLRSVWHFLTEEIMRPKQKEAQKSMEDILSWSLLPATRTQKGEKCLYLVPVRFADQVFMDSHFPISEHLRQGGFYIFHSLDENVRTLKTDTLPDELVVHLSNVGGILTGISKTLSSSLRANVIDLLKPELCQGILKHFSDQLEEVKKIPDHRALLGQMPLFVTVYNEGIEINGVKAIVLPKTVPCVGMEKWSQEESLVLLKENIRLINLYRYLELDNCSEIDFYCKYIFKGFGRLDEKARSVHLEFVRDNLIKRDGNVNLSDLQIALQELSFIPYNQKLERASFFYDHKHYLFKAMLKRHQFLPEPFRENEWYYMLTMAGLTNKVSADMFVKLAKQLEEGGCNEREEKTILEKSQCLIKNLFCEQKENSALLEKVKNIKFLVSKSASHELQAIALCYKSSPSMTCFNSSALPEHQDLVWSSCDVFREYCVPKDEKEKENILNRLGVKIEPTPEAVVQNLRNIVQSMNNDKQLQKHQHKTLDTLLKICSGIYTFLQSKKLSEDLKKILHNLPCVIIKDHRCFAKPDQVVVELKSENEITPYLFTLPKELGPFCELLVSVGVSNNVAVSHYENVLLRIRETCQDNDLEPNEMKAALKAMKGMYKKLCKSEGQVQIGKLYLPGKRGETCVIQKSCDIVISDNSYVEKRATGDLDFVFLLNLDEENVDKIDLWAKLPDSHRPRLLSRLVKAQLTESCRSECQQTEKCLKLQNVVSTPEVLHGIIRLIKHYRFEEGRHDCTVEIEEVQSFLSSIRIFCCSEISTCLMYQGSIISNSEDFSHPQHCEEVKGENTSEMHIVFIEKLLDDEYECCMQICNCLCNYHMKLPPKALVLIIKVLVLGYNQRSIHDYLNRQGIKEFHMNEPLQEKPDLPIPGSYVPVKFHFLLDQSFTFFEPGQYVGYEAYDPMLSSEDGDAIYIYAIVKEVCSAADASDWQTEYKIDIGEIITVPATDLYAFHRKQISTTGEIEVFSGHATNTHTPDATESKSLQEVKREIFKLLKDAWHKDEITKKKVLKRLLLKWHPDKNPEREEFCTKVAQYILALVKRFENGDFSAFEEENDTSDTTRGGIFYAGGSYGNFFTKANRRGNQYGQNFRAFNSRDTTDGRRYQGYYGHTSSNFPNPQPSEGRRWIRQAQADFEAIGNDEEGPKPSYSWICFKCQQSSCYDIFLQVAEKAMKAVLYKTNANHNAIRAHELGEIADGLNDPTLFQLAQELETTLGYKGYTRTRYPDMLHGQQTPSDVYTWTQAETSKDLCGKILHHVLTILRN
ncbi:sacsin-like [Liolophura sinensis]|uniref:sacsin-like n=1 Tax=Liolophura sinensis TaxID=3198878 RepID=UPI003159285D